MSAKGFSGNPKAEWVTEEGLDFRMKLLEDFYYVDPEGRRWDAPSGSIINGASIPRTLWTSVGSPYTGEYRRASIVHDVACENEDIPREEADKMFYFACLDGGCTPLQTKLLYAGVRIGDWFGTSDILMTTRTFSKGNRYRLPSEYTPEELEIRSKFTLIAKRLESTSGDFEDTRMVVDQLLN